MNFDKIGPQKFERMDDLFPLLDNIKPMTNEKKKVTPQQQEVVWYGNTLVNWSSSDDEKLKNLCDYYTKKHFKFDWNAIKYNFDNKTVTIEFLMNRHTVLKRLKRAKANSQKKFQIIEKTPKVDNVGVDKITKASKTDKLSHKKIPSSTKITRDFPDLHEINFFKDQPFGELSPINDEPELNYPIESLNIQPSTLKENGSSKNVKDNTSNDFEFWKEFLNE